MSWFVEGGYIGENSQCPTFNREIKINEWLNTLSQTSGQEQSNQTPRISIAGRPHQSPAWVEKGGGFSFIATQKQRR